MSLDIRRSCMKWLMRLMPLFGAISALSLCSSAQAESAASLIASGRAALVSHDIVTANTDFQAAVAASPTDQEANVLYAASQVFVLETQTPAQKLLNSLNVTSAGRDIFDWTARQKPGIPASATLTSDTFKTYATTILLPQLQSAQQNLAAVTDTSFSTTLSASEDGLADVTIDYGDVKLLEALVDAGIASIEAGDTFNSLVKSTDFAAWLRTNALTIQTLVAKYPALFTSSNPSYTAAFSAFSQSVTNYVAASNFIRARVTVTNNLFSIDPSEAGSEARLRNELVSLQTSITTTAVIGTTQVYLGALNSFGHSLRTLLPKFEENHAIPGTYPDLTFGGVLPGIAAAPVKRFFLQLGNGLDRRIRHRNNPADIVVSIASPHKNANILASSYPSVTVQGTAHAAVGVAQVFLSLTNTNGSTQTAIASGTTAWTYTFSNIIPGPNTITAYGVDIAGILSKPTILPFTYVKYESLPVSIISGAAANSSGGTVASSFYPTSSRELGVRYTISAKPASGYIFQSWTPPTGRIYDPFDYPGDTYLSASPTYTFTMSDGLALQANFIPTPFPAFAGQFASGATLYGADGSQTVGFLTMSVTSRGAFTAKLTGGGRTLQFSGQFNGVGVFSATIPAGAGEQAFVDINISELTDPTQGIAAFIAFRKNGRYAGSANGGLMQVPATNSISGNYTVQIQSDPSNPDSPQGYGWGTFTIERNGYVNFNGKLADGTPLSFTTALFNGFNGYAWNFSAPLYNGNGSIQGEMDPVTPNGNDFIGYLFWYSNGTGTGVFGSGFSAYPTAVTSPFSLPKNAPVISVSPGAGNLEVATDTVNTGGIATGIDDFVTLASNNKLTIPSNLTDHLKLSISTTTGVFTGSFLDIGDNITIPFSGVLLQNQDSAEGFYIGPTQSGLMDLVPQ